MKKYCVRIYQKLPTAKELVSEFLENDPIRLGNLERNLADINPEEEEVFSMFGPDDGCDEEEEGEEEEIVATNPNGIASSIIEALEEEEEET